MGAPELETNKFFSEFIGHRTVRKNSVSLSSADITKELAGSTQMERSALINPDELSRMQSGEIVFKIYGDQPVKTKLIHFYDRELQEKGYFVAGRPNILFNTKNFNRDAVFYDLLERDNHFDNLDEAEEIIGLAEEEFPEADVDANINTQEKQKTETKSTVDFVQMLKKKL